MNNSLRKRNLALVIACMIPLGGCDIRPQEIVQAALQELANGVATSFGNTLFNTVTIMEDGTGSVTGTGTMTTEIKDEE